MVKVHGMIVHQTGGLTAQSSLSSYTRPKANGAHFLIDRDETIYQTASLHKQTWHVGSLKTRCVVEIRCTPAELNALKRFDPRGEHRREMAKPVPERYPSNQDSIGIEIVGGLAPGDSRLSAEKGVYEDVNKRQNDSLRWLVQAISMTLSVPMTEVFRHPVVSRKNPTEAASAQW
jgi:N-acetyl-anhydromuramyl-L-alanine amidase AmpD